MYIMDYGIASATNYPYRSVVNNTQLRMAMIVVILTTLKIS